MDEHSRSAWMNFAFDARGIGQARALVDHPPVEDSDLAFLANQVVIVLCQLKAPGSADCPYGLFMVRVFGDLC